MPAVVVRYREAVQRESFCPLECELVIEGGSVAEVMQEATPANLAKIAKVYAAMVETGGKALAEALESQAPKERVREHARSR